MKKFPTFVRQKYHKEMTKTEKIRGLLLSYEDLGAGTPIVFIHGQPFNRSMWRYQVGPFSKTHRLIIPDLRGYGDTGLPITETGLPTVDTGLPTAHTGLPATDGLTHIILLDELALDLLHLLAALDIPNAIFIGLSMGGQIALELYRLKPQLFKGLVLADTDARAESKEGYHERIALSQKIRADGMQKFTDQRIHKFVCPHTFAAKPAVVAHLTEMMTTTSPAGSAPVQRGRAERRDHTSILKEIICPTLIIVGEEDAFTPIPTAEYMHTRIPGSQLAIIKDAGHIPSMEQPEKFNDILAAFITTIPT
jgi:pimeloyl-ACP methyl ester carboxylesterase